MHPAVDTLYSTGTHIITAFLAVRKAKVRMSVSQLKKKTALTAFNFTSEQRRKLRSKHKKKAKEMPISKEVEVNLLGNDSDAVQRSPAVEKSQLAVEDLLEILKCLDDMQSQISSLKMACSSSSLPTPHQKRSLHGEVEVRKCLRNLLTSLQRSLFPVVGI